MLCSIRVTHQGLSALPIIVELMVAFHTGHIMHQIPLQHWLLAPVERQEEQKKCDRQRSGFETLEIVSHPPKSAAQFTSIYQLCGNRNKSFGFAFENTESVICQQHEEVGHLSIPVFVCLVVWWSALMFVMFYVFPALTTFTAAINGFVTVHAELGCLLFLMSFPHSSIWLPFCLSQLPAQLVTLCGQQRKHKDNQCSILGSSALALAHRESHTGTIKHLLAVHWGIHMSTQLIDFLWVGYNIDVSKVIVGMRNYGAPRKLSDAA